MWRECGAIGPGCWRMTETREKRVRRQGDAAGRTATGHFYHGAREPQPHPEGTADGRAPYVGRLGGARHGPAHRLGSHTHISHRSHRRHERSCASGILDRSCGKKIITIPSESRFHVTRISYRYRKGIIRYHISLSYIRRVATPHTRQRVAQALVKLRARLCPRCSGQVS